MAKFPSVKHEHLHEDLPDKEICSLETEEWRLAFDGSSTHHGGCIGVLFYALNGTNISFPFKLEFFCTNNEAEYEALFIRLISTPKMGIHRLQVQEDSKLIIKQVTDFTLKEISLVPYLITIKN